MQKRDPRVQAHQKQQMKDRRCHTPIISLDLLLCTWQENIEKNQKDRAEKDRMKADQDSHNASLEVHVSALCYLVLPCFLSYVGLSCVSGLVCCWCWSWVDAVTFGCVLF